jgi:hypothetical protein
MDTFEICKAHKCYIAEWDEVSKIWGSHSVLLSGMWCHVMGLVTLDITKEGLALVFVDAFRSLDPLAQWHIVTFYNPQDTLSHVTVVHLLVLSVVQVECELLLHFEVNGLENKMWGSGSYGGAVGITLIWDVTERGLVCAHAHFS